MGKLESLQRGLRGEEMFRWQLIWDSQKEEYYITFKEIKDFTKEIQEIDPAYSVGRRPLG